jgi:uncharacterized protein
MSLAALCSYTFVLAVQSVSEVPDPRPASLVVDQAGVLDAAAEARLNGVLLGARDRLGPTLAVVTVDDVAGTPKEFATALFNHWQLGSAAKHDGVLVLLVMGKRRLEVETGTGIEPALPAWWLSEMQAAKMVPRFKQGAFGDGLEQGVMAMVERLGALPGEGERDTAPGEYHSDGTRVNRAPANGAPAERPPGTVDAPEDIPGPSTALKVVMGLGGLSAAGALGLLGRSLYRRRRCAKCKQEMFLLDEVADDAHLDAGQKTEEKVNSVNYDVLICRGCQDTRVLRHGRWFSGRSRCDACGYKTEKRTSETISHATYTSGGTVRVTETCAHCNRNHSYTRRTAKLSPPSTSSSSGGSSRSSSYSSSRSSSSSSSSRSSSSSSRSSGGSSRGGGAGSSW